METMSLNADAGYYTDYNENAGTGREGSGRTLRNFSPAFVNLIAEGGINFFRYLKNMGLPGEKEMLLLSSRHHYYYDASDLRSVKALINLKQLNVIRHPDVFLGSLVRMLPYNAKFAGCFIDSSNNRHSLGSRLTAFARKIVNVLDSRIERKMDRTKVAGLLEEHGLQIIDMTEINGVTYFYTQNLNRIFNV